MSSSEREQLKPCPFCGSSAHFEKDDAGWQWIECESCGMQGNRGASLMENCRPMLAEQWNRRATAGAGEPVAWLFQHDETGRMTCVANDGMNTPEVFTRLNPRQLYVGPAYAAPQHAPLTEGQRAVIDFLYGVGDLQGVGFGDKPAGERGNYWWRKHLREAFGITAAKESNDG